MKSKKKVFHFLLAFCVVLGFAIRIGYYFRFPVQSRDSYIYCELTKEWNNTHIIPTYQEKTIPPLGIFLMREPSYLFDYDVIMGAILVNMILGLFIIVILMLIAYRITQTLFAPIAVGIIACFHTTLIRYSTQFLRDNSYVFFICLTILMLIKYIHTPKRMTVFYGGIALTAAILCRYEAIELLIPWTAVLLICNSPGKKWTDKICRIVQFGIICLISFFTIIWAINVPFSFFYKGYSAELKKITITRPDNLPF